MLQGAEKTVWLQSFSPKCGVWLSTTSPTDRRRWTPTPAKHVDQRCLPQPFPLLLAHSATAGASPWRLASLQHCKLLPSATGKGCEKTSQRQQGSISGGSRQQDYSWCGRRREVPAAWAAKQDGKWGWVWYPAPSPGTTFRRGSYLGEGCQRLSWGLVVAGSHRQNKKTWLWGSTQTQGPTPSALSLCCVLTLLWKRIKEWQNLYASDVSLIPHPQYKLNLDQPYLIFNSFLWSVVLFILFSSQKLPISCILP